LWLNPYFRPELAKSSEFRKSTFTLHRKASSYSGLSVAQTWRVRHEPKRKHPAPLDPEALQRLALFYVGRYATTRAKLRDYLKRKLTERGWEHGEAPNVEALIGRFSDLGYIDDRAFAEARTSSLQRRGYGERRIGQALHAAGIGIEDASGALDQARDGAWKAALRYAKRRRIGPYAQEKAAGREAWEKAFSAMVRAGHSFEMVRKILSASPGEVLEQDDL
jgi:regulatory protein